MFETTRRRALQALGVGGATAVAGCSVRAPTADAENQRKRVEQQSVPSVDRVAADPTDVPDPIDRSEPTDVDVTLRPEEVTAEIEPGVIFDFMTDNGQVPGPMIRVRNGDTVNLTFENPAENVLPHNVDFHAAAGPGGGAEATMTAPGETAHLGFKATYPGAYLHCDAAVPRSGQLQTRRSRPEPGRPSWLSRHCHRRRRGTSRHLRSEPAGRRV